MRPPSIYHNLKFLSFTHTDVRHFLQLAGENSKIIAKYFSAGGKTLELVQALDRIDKNDATQISYVFNAIQLTLIEVLSNATQLTQPTIQACSYLLNSHRPCIEKLLNSFLASHKKSVLKLLTAVVALDAQFGREILNTLNVVFNAETLQRFTEHSKSEMRRDDTAETVRTCYIHFILAYLIEGNVTLIRNLLDRNELVMAVSSGLIYDGAETVCLVLSTLQRFVLMSNQVSKTKKIQVFNIDVVRKFMHLYDWKGPQYFIAMFGRQTKDKAESYVNDDDRNAVADSLHEFMTMLLASRKYGIAFQCLGFRRTKSNNIQKRVLADLDRPWIDSRRTKLSIDMIKACPELSRSFLKVISPALDPSSKQHNWFEAVDYFCQFIAAMSPSIIRSGIENMTPKETTQVVKAICMAPEILQYIRNKPTLKNESIDMRWRSTKLLNLMFGLCSRFLHEIGLWSVYSSGDMKKMKFDFINHVFVFCPSVENILLSLHMTLKTVDDNVNVFPHLESVLDLLLIISKTVPSFIERTSSVINYINILRPLYEMNRGVASVTRIELKAVKLILALEPTSLSRETDLFAKVMQSFFNVLVFGASDERQEVKKLLRNVFINSGIFENGVLEIDIWLDEFAHIDVDAQTEVQEFFVEAITNFSIVDTDGNAGPATKNESNTKTLNESSRNIVELFHKIENGITLCGNIDAIVTGHFFMHFVSKFNECGAPAAILPYIDAVGFSLFNYLPEPQSIYVSLKSNRHQHAKLMKNWLKHQKQGILIQHWSDNFMRFYNGLFEKSEDFADIFRATNSSTAITFTINGVAGEFDERLGNETHVMLLMYVVLFGVQYWTDHNQFDEEKQSVVEAYLKALTEIIHQLSADELKTVAVGFEDETSVTTVFKNAVRYMFTGRLLLLNNFDIWSDTPVTRLTLNLIDHLWQFTETEQLNEELFEHFRSKAIQQIASSSKNIKPPESIANDLKIFRLNAEHCQSIIDSMLVLWRQIDDSAKQNELKSAYGNIISMALIRLAELRTTCLTIDTVRNLSEIYLLEFKSNANVQVDAIETSIHTYLSIFSQSIEHISVKFFEDIILCETEKFTKTTIRLAALLLERNPSLPEIFVRFLPQLLAKRLLPKETIYPLLNVIVWRRPVISATVLTALYDEFKQGILRAIEKPLKSGVIYRENIYSSMWLIDRCMPLNHCIDFAKKTLKFDGAEVYQVQIIKAIHTKALNAEAVEVQQQVFVNFLNIVVQLLVIQLKRDEVDWCKLSAYGVIISEWMTLKHKLRLPSLEKIRQSPTWVVFGRACLKHGIHMPYDEEKKLYDNRSAILLKLMGSLCDHIYPDGNEADVNADAGTFFELAISHSEFLAIALNQSVSDVKTYLMYVLFVLAKKNQAAFQSTHVPIFLSAYQAKLSACDRFILPLLQLYECNGVNVSAYKPFIWGESAIAYYSLKEAAETKTNLDQAPPMMQAISLIDLDTADQSLTKFPVWRKLDAIAQVPTIEFHGYGIVGNQYLEGVTNASNRLERHVEQQKFDSELQTLCSLKDDAYNEIYDPAFYVPLMSMAFGPDTYTRPVRPAQNGLLAMCFAALSSQDKAMRLAAANVLQRYRTHLETSRFLDNKVWTHLYDTIQRGLSDLTTEMRRHKKSRIPRAPFVAGLFLARTVNILSMPLNEMYRPLSSYLLLKNKFDFLTVPEFNVLFQSPDVNSAIHRHFILEVLRDGLKCGSDFTILLSMNIFKALLGFYDSPMTTRETNLLILTVINAAIKIPKSTQVMVDHIGLLPWLSATIDNIDFFQFDIIDGMCSIISNIWYSMKFNSLANDGRIDEIEQRLLCLLLKLGDKLSSRIAQSSYAKYVNILMQVTRSSNRSRFVGEKLVITLVELSKVHAKSDLADIDYKQASVLYWESSFAFVGRLRDAGMDEHLTFIAAATREIVVNWLKNNL